MNQTMHRKKVGLISTINTNIGDEFIRDGVLEILETAGVVCEESTISIFNKHQPWTMFPRNHPARYSYFFGKYFGRGTRRAVNILSRIPGSLLDGQDLIVQCGTPIIWANAEKTAEWGIPFWRNIAPRVSKRIPIWNLGGGSCYSYKNPPTELPSTDLPFAQLLVNNSSILTVRDELAAQLLSPVARRTIPVIECPALLAGQRFAPPCSDPENLIVLNVMNGAGHFDYENEIESEKWFRQIDALIESYKADHRFLFVCHDDKEFSLAKSRWKSFDVFKASSPSDFFGTVKTAKFGVVNRLHAAVGMAGLGIPCIAVGTDTRMMMASKIGITTIYAGLEFDLVNKVSELISEAPTTKMELGSKRHFCLSKYLDVCHVDLSQK
jgi:hypothetical protein